MRETTLGYHGPDAELGHLTEIRLGWFGPTNLDDPLTGDLWWAAHLAVEEANHQNLELGTGNWEVGARNPKPESRNPPPATLPFRLIPRWSENPWGTGVSQLTRMVYEDQPLALLGSVDSASTHLAEQVVAKANLPLVSPIATDKSVTLAGVSWMFACAPSDAAIAHVLVDDILATLRAPNDTLVVLACTDHESRMTAREILKEFAGRCRLPNFRFDVPPGAQRIDRQIAALAESAPGAVLIIAGADDAARLVRSVRERLPPAEADSACRVFGSQAMGRTHFRAVAGPAAESVRFPLLFSPLRANAATARFIEQFNRTRGYPPDYAAALAYDATRLLIDAIRQAGPSRTRVRQALAQRPPWPGIAGPIQFDGTGQNRRTNLCMGTIRNGQIVPIIPEQEPDPTACHDPMP